MEKNYKTKIKNVIFLLLWVFIGYLIWGIHISFIAPFEVNMVGWLTRSISLTDSFLNSKFIKDVVLFFFMNFFRVLLWIITCALLIKLMGFNRMRLLQDCNLGFIAIGTYANGESLLFYILSENFESNAFVKTSIIGLVVDLIIIPVAVHLDISFT